MGAAASVIAARTMSMANPTAETAAEMNLMISEKVAAFSEAGAAMTAGASTMASQGARYAAGEAAAASRGMAQLATCRTPFEVMMVQGRLVADFFGRGFAYGMGLNALVARTGDKTLAPVHKTVTANDRRLKAK
ncbi:MAG TPA: phasin family protein [Caulobacteraceae bacterium]|nr:phasin family protein [Caulobacteraceae bacterium]